MHEMNKCVRGYNECACQSMHVVELHKHGTPYDSYFLV